MAPTAALAALRAASVRVGLRPHGSVSLGAVAPPSPELLEAARRHREEIAGLLRAEAGQVTDGQAVPDAPVLVGTASETIGCSDQPSDPLDELQEWLDAHTDEVAEWGGVPDLSRLVVPSEAMVAGLLEGYHRHRPGTA